MFIEGIGNMKHYERFRKDIIPKVLANYKLQESISDKIQHIMIGSEPDIQGLLYRNNIPHDYDAIQQDIFDSRISVIPYGNTAYVAVSGPVSGTNYCTRG